MQISGIDVHHGRATVLKNLPTPGVVGVLIQESPYRGRDVVAHKMKALQYLYILTSAPPGRSRTSTILEIGPSPY